MADRAQPQQRNLYQEKFAHLEYSGRPGTDYKEQLRKLSWPVADDVPVHAQRSSTSMCARGGYSPLHPLSFMNSKHLALPTFMQTYGTRGLRAEADPSLPASLRLFTPSKTMARPMSRSATSRPECDGDAAFGTGRVKEAIRLYTQAIAQGGGAANYIKRCAAYAHLGEYDAALADAEMLLAAEGSPSARLRVKSIKDFLKTRSECTTGYKTSHVTLVCSLTPKELRQWRAATPSVYTLG